MDAADRALLAKTVRDAIAGVAQDQSTRAIDGVLADLGWLDMLGAEPSVAIEIVFSALGSTNGRATALDDVLVAALSIEPRAGLAALLPPFGAWEPPGRVGDDRLVAHGLASARAITADEMLVVCDAGADVRVVTVPVADAEVTAVHGVDPDARFHTVRVDAPAGRGTTLRRGEWDAAVGFARRAVAA